MIGVKDRSPGDILTQKNGSRESFCKIENGSVPSNKLENLAQRAGNVRE